jgi:hypothetical protein
MSVEAYLERLIRVVTEMQLDPESLPPLTRQALGLLSPMTDEEVAQALDEYRTKKYGGA